MKGLILKDLYMTKKYFRNYLFIMILFLGLSFASEDNLFVVFYPGLLATMIPVNLLAYDERSHWDMYCGTLPVTRDMVVSAKYLMELMLLGLVYVLTGAVQVVRMVVNQEFHWQSFLVLMSLLFILVPSLISSTSMMIIPSGALAIGIAWLLYRKQQKGN